MQLKRLRHPLEAKITEIFLPGRPGGLAKLTEWVGRRREVQFFVQARQDGLCCREEDLGRKIIDRYEGRSDNMSYRSVTVHEDMSGGAKPAYTLPGVHGAPDLIAEKMAVKFDRNETQPASLDVAKRSYYIKEGRIRTLYHYGEGRVTREQTVHYKDRHLNAQTVSGSIEKYNASGGGGSSGGVGLLSAEDVAGELNSVQIAERDTLQEVRRLTIEINELLRQRRREEDGIEIYEPIFDSAPRQRHEEQAAKSKGVSGGSEVRDSHDEIGFVGTNNESSILTDYLTPFIASNVVDPMCLTRDEAQRTRDACLKSMKDRLLERANIIQNRLNEENQRLSKKQATFQRNSSRENDPAAEEGKSFQYL